MKKTLKTFYDRLPSPVKNIYRFFKSPFVRSKPQFTGWGMQTIHAVPWQGDVGCEVFLKSAEDIKKGFQFYSGTGVTPENADELKWRHWNICSALKYAVKFSQLRQVSLAECGVCDGMSAFFVLRELEGLAQKGHIVIYNLHLYDAWQAMRMDELKANEAFLKNKYDGISLDSVKKNLAAFGENITYHPGFIPESFAQAPRSPEQIIFLHVDLNASVPTLRALEHFYPRLVRGAVIVFDDYGQVAYSEVKKSIDAFFEDKPGHLMPLATSQAIYFR